MTSKLENLKKEIAKTKQKIETTCKPKQSLVKLFSHHKAKKKVSNTSSESSLESDSD